MAGEQVLVGPQYHSEAHRAAVPRARTQHITVPAPSRCIYAFEMIFVKKLNEMMIDLIHSRVLIVLSLIVEQ